MKLRTCACGCGSPTPPAKQSTYGNIKGLPRKYIPGHHLRLLNVSGSQNHSWKGGTHRHPLGYIKLLIPTHPRADCKGYVSEHLVVVERALGKYLRPGAHIHHVNGDPSDNRTSNLVVCENHAYHHLLHARARALKRPAFCQVDGCHRPVKIHKHGFCNRHYLRFLRHGDPKGGQPTERRTPTHTGSPATVYRAIP